MECQIICGREVYLYFIYTRHSIVILYRELISFLFQFKLNFFFKILFNKEYLYNYISKPINRIPKNAMQNIFFK